MTSMHLQTAYMTERLTLIYNSLQLNSTIIQLGDKKIVRKKCPPAKCNETYGPDGLRTEA
jgi:hypothetical protein